MFVSSSGGPPRVGLWRTHDKFAVLNALQPDQSVSQLMHLTQLPFHHDDLKAHVMVQMRMHGGDDDFVIFVLQFH